jgi:hypothetical protein
MATVLMIVFIVGTIVMLWRMASDTIAETISDTLPMPFRCPVCGRGEIEGGSPILPTRRPWYITLEAGRVCCRHCDGAFREHPNGTLVEDKPVIIEKPEP